MATSLLTNRRISRKALYPEMINSTEPADKSAIDFGQFGTGAAPA
jgi:hypothetical protein